LAARFVRSRHCAAAFFLQVPKSCTDLDPTLLYISTFGTYSRFVRKNKMLALGVCLPQSRRATQVYHVKITCELLLPICFVSTTTNSMKCLVNWIPMNAHVRFENTQPCLKVGLGISRTNADSQWNPVYNAFHRIFCCGNESILQ